MNYNSTRNAALQVTAAQAIAQGISEEGGLFVPQSFPKADLNDMLGSITSAVPSTCSRAF